jgi:hypothetical protein
MFRCVQSLLVVVAIMTWRSCECIIPLGLWTPCSPPCIGRVLVSPEPIPAASTQELEAPRLFIDTFTFNGEIAAEVRLNATGHLLDYIFVVEAWWPFAETAPRKPFLYSSLPYVNLRPFKFKLMHKKLE